MMEKYTILVADRNPNVRKLLRRELSEAGYYVVLAKDTKEVIARIYRPDPLDLVILDLNLPNQNGGCILKKVQDRIPDLPVIVHSFSSDYNDIPTVSDTLFKDTAFVEKQGNSVEILKKIASDILNRRKKEKSDLTHRS